MRAGGGVGRRTGELYSELFEGFDEGDYRALVSRFAGRVAVGEGWFRGKICLDAGVGSGRALSSMAGLGAGRIVGIDLGDGNIRNASRRTSDLRNVALVKASVLDLPFRDGAFDFVHCSGVLHHTPSPERGFRELVRALKQGGLLSVGVYGKGGLINWFISLGRILVRPIPMRLAMRILSILPLSRIIVADILDYLYVPVQSRHTEDEVRGWFAQEGVRDARRVAIEKYDYARPMSRLLWGEGWVQMQGFKGG